MTTPRIAVVVPTIGEADALARCLDALLPAAPDEVVIVDQSGDDAVARVVEAVDGSAAVRRVVSEARGLSAARNLGARSATADVLAFTDDDCVPDGEWLAELGRAFARDDAPAAVTGPMLPLAGAPPGLVAVSSRTSRERREFTGRALPWEVGTGGNTAVSRAWLDRVGGFDERLGVGTPGHAGEDLDLFRRVLQAGGRIVYEPDAVCRHEQKTPAERRARRASYGLGAGAALGLWLREGDPRALPALARRETQRARMAGRGSATDELRVLGGTVRGLAYGLRLSSWA